MAVIPVDPGTVVPESLLIPHEPKGRHHHRHPGGGMSPHQASRTAMAVGGTLLLGLFIVLLFVSRWAADRGL